VSQTLKMSLENLSRTFGNCIGNSKCFWPLFDPDQPEHDPLISSQIDAAVSDYDSDSF